MTLSAPRQPTFYLGSILWLLGLMAPYVDPLNGPAFQGMSVGYVLALLGGLVLLLGCVFKNF